MKTIWKIFLQPKERHMQNLLKTLSTTLNIELLNTNAKKLNFFRWQSLSSTASESPMTAELTVSSSITSLTEEEQTIILLSRQKVKINLIFDTLEIFLPPLEHHSGNLPHPTKWKWWQPGSPSGLLPTTLFVFYGGVFSIYLSYSGVLTFLLVDGTHLPNVNH